MKPRGGRIVPPMVMEPDSVVVRLSRGEAFVPRAAYNRAGPDALVAMNDGDTHLYVVEPDGSVTDTEESN